MNKSTHNNREELPTGSLAEQFNWLQVRTAAQKWTMPPQHLIGLLPGLPLRDDLPLLVACTQS